MDLNKLNITNVAYDTYYGFFWVEFDNQESLRCCLILRADGNGFRKAVYRDDNGHDWGNCADVNDWAKPTDCEEYESFNEINKFLMKQARKAGLQVL